MQEEQENICPDCGKTMEKKGSMTQWLGLGEQCRCASKSQTTTAGPGKKKEQTCRRCLKPRQTKSQSMTQWLFKKDYCNCQEQEKNSVNPVKIVLAQHKYSVLPESRKNKIMTNALFGSIASFAVLYAAIVLDVPSQIHVLLYSSKKCGIAREFLCGYSPYECNDAIRIEDGALSFINTRRFSFLKVEDSNVSDQELHSIANLRYLKGISLVNCSQYTSTGIDSLMSAPNLIQLSLAHSKLEKIWLPSLAEKQLQSLDLSSTHIDHEDLSYFASVPTLKMINLRGIIIPDATRKALEDANFLNRDGLFERD